MQPTGAIIVSWGETLGMLLFSASGNGWKRRPCSNASFGSLCQAFASEMIPLQGNLVMLRASCKVHLCSENLAFLWLFTYLFAFLTTGEVACSKEAQFSKNAQHLPSNPPRRHRRMSKITQNWAPQTPQQAGDAHGVVCPPVGTDLWGWPLMSPCGPPDPSKPLESLMFSIKISSAAPCFDSAFPLHFLYFPCLIQSTTIQSEGFSLLPAACLAPWGSCCSILASHASYFKWEGFSLIKPMFSFVWGFFFA